MAEGWRFWIDQGGTFTDVVARRPGGEIVTAKLLSESSRYADAATEAIRNLLELNPGDPIDEELVAEVKMGTTVATNALLERQGEPTVLVTTRGFGDALRIGYQSRPDLFALDIVLPDVVYDRVIEINERVLADGTVKHPLDEDEARQQLAIAAQDGVCSAAIVLMHGYRYPAHEARLATIAAEVGFEHVSSSHQVNPLIRLVSRGDTTVVDAYLTPVLRRHIQATQDQIDAPLSFMQSNGGLAHPDRFKGKDALLSGPAGGVVGMASTGETAGYGHLIGFDMGGTSTDVSHYNGHLERTTASEVAGVRVRAPMILIHTVAAGGGSVLNFDGSRFRVGPNSAGADPGPACYGNGGPLTVTDANVLLGRLHPDHFPAIFGPNGNQPIDVLATRSGFTRLAAEVSEATGQAWAAESVAEGFLAVAVQNMANAIKTISVQKGHDVSRYTLACFGGAGGQHACRVADELGMSTVLIHPHAGVLSALGIGLADIRSVAERAIGRLLTPDLLTEITPDINELATSAARDVTAQTPDSADTTHPPSNPKTEISTRLFLSYEGSDTALEVPMGSYEAAVSEFEAGHQTRFGFVSPETPLVLESIQVEAVERTGLTSPSSPYQENPDEPVPMAYHRTSFGSHTMETPFYDRSTLSAGTTIAGTTVIVDPNSTTVVEPGWAAGTASGGELILTRTEPLARSVVGTEADPVMLEIFNNLFSNVAEQMGVTLENTAVSVNIKERLDFSCAVFDPRGELIANAPHVPVHLGSMDISVQAVISQYPDMAPGDAFVVNAPYNGGTHLPDVTVVMPVFDTTGAEQSPGEEGQPPPAKPKVLFYTGARGHHGDIGGTTPGSAPADSTSIAEEGVLFDGDLLASGGRFREAEIRSILTNAQWPARNPDLNIADLKAQLAACHKGASVLTEVIAHYGLNVVHSYMGHVRANAAESVRRLIDRLEDASFTATSDDGSQVAVEVRVHREARRATVDFTGTSQQHPGNFNAPEAVARAAVLFVLRCLVEDDIPLNSGCLEPIDLILPSPSLISPVEPAAVFAGNVETSQLIVDTLFGALGTMAASQGTMNNVVWGNQHHQYYETLCGGAGATPRRDGCDAVHTGMTNSRLTDPEVLEWRYPVVVEDFSIRRGSGGAGRHRGGDGVVRRIRFREPMNLNVLSSRRLVPPYGLAGGHPGAVGINRVQRADGTIENHNGVFKTNLKSGDILEIATPGGGGHGPPQM